MLGPKVLTTRLGVQQDTGSGLLSRLARRHPLGPAVGEEVSSCRKLSSLNVSRQKWKQLGLGEQHLIADPKARLAGTDAPNPRTRHRSSDGYADAASLACPRLPTRSCPARHPATEHLPLHEPPALLRKKLTKHPARPPHLLLTSDSGANGVWGMAQLATRHFTLPASV